MISLNIHQELKERLLETKQGLIFVLILATILNASLLLFTRNAGINNDGKLYIAAAKQLAMGHFAEALAIYPMPSYSALISYVHSVIPDWILAARLISVICWILVLAPVYLLTTDLFDRRAAFWACLLLAVTPEIVRLAPLVLRDHPYTLLFLWAAYFAQRAVGAQRMVYAVAAGVLACLSLLFRLEGVILLAACSFFFPALAIWKGEGRMMYLRMGLVWLISIAALGLAGILMIGPDKLATYRYGEYARYVRPLFDLKAPENVHQIQIQLKALQEASPAPEWSQNFAEIATRFMALFIS
jgi:hypothetical protein